MVNQLATHIICIIILCCLRRAINESAVSAPTCVVSCISHLTSTSLKLPTYKTSGGSSLPSTLRASSRGTGRTVVRGAATATDTHRLD
jgi:hypothetical protein